MGLLSLQRTKLELLHGVVVESRLAAAHLLRAALEEVASALQFDHVLLARNDKERLHIDSIYGRGDRDGWERLPLENAFPQFPFPDEACSVPDVSDIVELQGNELIARLGVRSFVAWPMVAQGRTWHCLFASRQRRNGPHTDDEMKLIDAFTTIISRLLELREEQRVQAEHVSNDPLTGLLNRSATLARIRDAMASAERNHTGVAVLYLDVDRFKWINDTFGHPLGDVVLREIGKRLKVSLRPYDVAGRIGGDEFAIIISDFSNDDELGEISQRLIEAISKPLTVEHQDLSVTATIGVAVFPNDSSSVEDLIRHADAAMYEAKRDGAGKFAFYNASAEERVKSRRVISEGLRANRMEREFILCLQPIVDARSARLRGAEVLTRWMHPEMGLLPPSKYIEIARDSRLSATLDAWVICKSMEVALEFAKNGQGIVLHTNVSEPSEAVLDAALQFADHEAAAEFTAIEINEAVIAKNFDRCKAFIARCRSLGIRVGIDGFGSAGIPLSKLSALRIDFIKIDRQLTAQIVGRSTTPAIEIALTTARQFGWEIVAEGVQSEIQRDRLAQAGADFIQGYLVGHPMTLIDFRAWRESASNGM